MFKGYLKETNARVVIVALLVIICGMLLLMAADSTFLQAHSTLQTLARNIGAFFIGTASVALLWELSSKRVFMRDLLAAVRLSADIRTAGITGFTLDYLEPDWDALFRRAKEIDFFFSYASTWRKVYIKQISHLANRSDVRLRIMLPDSENTHVVRTLAYRFRMNEEQVKQAINDAIEFFIDIFKKGKGKNTTLSIWLVDRSPEYAFYRFDQNAVITFFNHLGRTGKVPTFQLTSGGNLFEFARDEFEELIDAANGHVRKLHPPHEGETNVTPS